MAAPLEKQTFYTVKINGQLLDVTGRKRTPKGYVQLCVKDHPNADVLGYVMEHRIMMEMKIGRFLEPHEVVHHLNEKKHDNRLSNLELMSHTDHTVMHHTGAKRSKETKDLIAKKMKARLAEKKNHPMYKDVDDELIKLFKEGLTRTEIGRRLGITRHSVSNKISYLGLEEIND